MSINSLTREDFIKRYSFNKSLLKDINDKEVKLKSNSFMNKVIKKSSVAQAVGTQAFPVPVSWILFKNLLRYYD